MEFYQLSAETRDVNVRNPFRKSVDQGYIPAVLYNKESNLPIKVPRHDFDVILKKLNSNSIIEISLGDTKHKAIVKDYCEEMSRRNLIKHIDFFMIDPDREFLINIPIETTGHPRGVVLGGVLENKIDRVPVKCKLASVPDSYTIDISELGLGEVIRADALCDYDNVTLLQDKGSIIVSISDKTKAAKSTAKSEGDSEAAAEEEKSSEAAD